MLWLREDAEASAKAWLEVEASAYLVTRLRTLPPSSPRFEVYRPE